MSELTPLAQFGVVGISMGLIILVAFMIKELFSFIRNHIKHNIETMQELKDTIKELKDYLIFCNGKK